MRDDRARWAPPGTAKDAQDLGDARLTPITGLTQVMRSGPQVLKAGDGGWPQPISEDSYRVALRRDRVLELRVATDGAPRPATGWDAEAGEAVSDASSLYAVYDLTGPGALSLLQRGTEITHDVPSRSVVRLVFGIDVLLYRRDESTYRLHVPAAQAEGFVHHLKAAYAGRSGAPA